MKILLCLVLVGLTGCSRPVQRFVPLVVPAYHDDAAGSVSPDIMALDTKTGRACNPFMPRKGQSSTLPLCYDLFKGKD
jgi:hypothetical protein